MKDHQLVVNVEDFRAVKKAELILDGITVVAGENGCGKSTLSKLLYYLFKTANEYEYYLVQDFHKDVSNLRFIIEDLCLNASLFGLGYQIKATPTLDKYFESFSSRLFKLREFFNERNVSESLFISSSIKRAIHIMNTKSQGQKGRKVTTELELINELELQTKELFEVAYEKRLRRPSHIFNGVVTFCFNNESLPEKLNLIEDGYPIYSTNQVNILKIHSVDNVAYVDTPMAVGLDGSSDNEHWNDLNNLLKEKKGQSGNGDIASIQSQILDGDIVLDNDITKRFIYKRNDGKEFDLMSCATGVKSFAILQLLYKNGHLNDKTLLIIDEPEVHLHPQWIVEYARLMVLLNKELGVKFFVASHNPDMVSAIKYIAEREQTDANLNFYLAEKEADEFTYTYRHLGTEIDDIFTSFNIAFDRINLYGTLE